MKSKRSILLCLALVLSMAMAMGSTLAYLQDSDSDVNVMTLGNVDIEQIEQQRGENGDLVEFASKKESSTYVELNPGVYLDGLTKDETTGYYAANVNNALDKIVSVKNVGSRAAYVRTMFAFEQGSLAGGELEKLLYINWNSAVEPERLDDDVEIDGKLYTVYQVVYPEPLGFTEPNNTTAPSLLQVLLSKEAEREDMQALDPDGDGLYEIKVVSQAVQAAGFESVGAKRALEEAFGTHFPGAMVYNTVNSAEELVTALSEGGRIQLGADMAWTLAEDFEQNNEVVLDLNGKTLTVPNAYPKWKNWNVHAPMTVEDSVGGGSIAYSGYFNLYAHMMHTGGRINLNTINSLMILKGGGYTINGENAMVYCENNAALNIAPSGVTDAATVNIITGTIKGYHGISGTEKNRPVTLNISGGQIIGTSQSIGVGISFNNLDVVTISGSPVINGGSKDISMTGGTLDMSGLTGDESYTITKTNGTFDKRPCVDAWNISENGNTITISPKTNKAAGTIASGSISWTAICDHTIPMPISTSNATITTSAEIMKPWIMGRMPAFFMLAKEVFRPMAASAQTIRNLLADLVPLTTCAGIGKMLATMDIARKPRMNQGNIFLMENSALSWLPSC